MAASFALASCVSNPYVAPAVPRPGAVPSASLAAALANLDREFQPGTTNPKTVYFSVDSAALYGRYVQDAYQKALTERSNARSASNLGQIWIGLTALGLEATDTGGDTTLITALTATGLGISSQVLITKDHEAAYSLGAKTISCVLTAATNTRPSSAKLTAVKSSLNDVQVLLAEYENVGRLGLDYVNAAVATTERQAQDLPAAEARLLSAKAKPNPQDAQGKANLAAELKQADEDVKNAQEGRENLAAQRASANGISANFNLQKQRIGDQISYTNALLEDSDLLGQQLLNKIEEIRWEVNDAVRRTEPDLIVLDAGLRSIVSSRLAFANQTIPSGASTPVTVPKKTEHSDEGSLQSEWSKSGAADVEGALLAAVAKLQKALEAAEGAPILRFPADAFTGCSSSEITGITAPGPIAVSPATQTIQAGYKLGAISVTITGGRGPYQATTTLNVQPTIQDNVVRIPVKETDAVVANSPIQTTVTDLYGHAAVFSIIIQPAEPAPAANTPAPATQSSYLKSEKVAEVQKFLRDVKFSDDGTMKPWLTTKKATDGKLKDAGDFTDEKFGPTMRYAAQLYFTTERKTATLDNLKPANSGNQPSGCPALAAKLLPLLKPPLAADATDIIAFYEDDALGLTKEHPTDAPLVDFLVTCELLN